MKVKLLVTLTVRLDSGATIQAIFDAAPPRIYYHVQNFHNLAFEIKGEFCSKYKEIYSSPPIIFDTTESFTESCKQTLFTALSKRLSWVKYNGR